MRFERVLRQVFDMLQEVRLGTVVAVWSDGGVSAHRDLGFRFRTLPSGRKEEALTTFIADGAVPSVTEIRERIKRAAGLVGAE